MMRGLLARLHDDRSGATIIEFAIVSPVMCLLMMGLGDLLYQEYAQSVLAGAVQKAGRDAGIEGNAVLTSTIDGRVVTMMTPLIKNLTNNCPTPPAVATARTWCSTRKSYDTFTEVAPEPFVDTNKNGVRDPGECFTDTNGNGTWDSDPGIVGEGGASAVALYTFSITYPRLFPIARMMGWSANQTISSSTLLKNQPYATQTVTANTTVCT